MGWALDNLGEERCKAIAEGLMRVEKVYGTKLHGFCPIHGDTKSASAFYNWAQDSGGCQSCGEKWDLINLWCMVNGYDRQDIKAFREEFDDGYTGSTGQKKKRPVARPAQPKASPAPLDGPEVFVDLAEYHALLPLSEEQLNMLRRVRGWTLQKIEELGLKRFIDAQKREKIAIPIWTESGELGNIRLYQPGAAQFKVISWYDKVCPSCGGAWKLIKGQPKVCKECGGSPNDYGRTRLFPSPSMWRPGALWLCEGEPDTICALSHGLNAVTQTAGCGTWREHFSEAMAGRDVVICYDADHAGFKGACTAAESLVHHAKSVRMIQWPELMKA